MWNLEERCNISDRFVQILNIALSATRDFRYVNAGQMIRSLKPIIAIPEPKIDPTRINPAIASAKANQIQNEGSQDVSQDDLSMPTVAEASQYLNPNLGQYAPLVLGDRGCSEALLLVIETTYVFSICRFRHPKSLILNSYPKICVSYNVISNT